MSLRDAVYIFVYKYIVHMGMAWDFWNERRDSSRMQFNDIFQNMKYIPLDFVYSVYPREIYSFSSVKPWNVFACISNWYQDLAYYLFATPMAMTMLRQRCSEEDVMKSRILIPVKRFSKTMFMMSCSETKQGKVLQNC